ncbi:carboxylic ester hydrolase-like [Cylas formicarius]|uniref:carboxylic ester hydrolase-like n=1 Tax=Cylas formicarius TaxID=197179 RepID=UPI00295863E2|nr:carboxylic ester hydrolase-like [Cylas formicarius]
MFFTIFWCCYFFLQADGSHPQITLPDGEIRGHKLQTDNGKTYYAFLGLPYAAPPLGNLRFQAPVNPEHWKGVRDATKKGDACLAIFDFTPPSYSDKLSEDCLKINVFTPSFNNTQKFPVMFWIHGGGFVGGSGNFYGPDFLIEEDVVVVTFNYRLGAFGFLSTGDDVVLGNAGLKDQLLALNWTNRNIGLFGGDPDKITIFGESAGGRSVGHHITNKKSKGLFRAAICQSGCSLLGLHEVKPKEIALDLAQRLDSELPRNISSVDLLNFLQNQSADAILSKSIDMNPMTYLFVPIMEVDHVDSFITELNYNLVETGNVSRVPLILGTVSEECLGFIGDLNNITLTAASYDSDITTLIPNDIHLKENCTPEDAANLIREAYVGPNGNFSDNLAATLQYYSDNLFGKATLKQAELASDYTSVYLYEFSYYGIASETRVVIEGAGKVGHGDELTYLFKFLNLTAEADILTSKRFAKLWANFAKYLDPTPETSSLLQNVSWPKVENGDIRYLDIDETLSVKPNNRAKEYAMWNYVYENFASRPYMGF